jgi:hypothetical protein
LRGFAPGTSPYVDSGITRGLKLEVVASGYPVIQLKADVYGTPDCSGSIKTRVESINDSFAGRWSIKGLTPELTGSPGAYRISKADTGH